MDANSRAFDHNQVEQICRILGNELTGTGIGQLLARLGFDDPAPQTSKWARLLEAIELQQAYEAFDGSSSAVIRFIEAVMVPVKYALHPMQFEDARAALNRVLAFSGHRLGEDGKVVEGDTVHTLAETQRDSKATASRELIDSGAGEPVSEPELKDHSKPIEVALSYASEQREYVEPVARRLKREGVSVFYDRDEDVPLWGKSLPDELERVYGHEARVCVMFISAQYVHKAWTNYERQIAVQRAIKQCGVFILPVCFDDAEVPGPLQHLSHMSAHDFSPEELAEKIIEKLKLPG